MPYKLGKKPAQHDRRTLKLANYVTAALPQVPDQCDWSNRVTNWPLYKNDVLRDCAIASVGHVTQLWTGDKVIPTEDQVVSDYLAISPNDQGCVMLEVLNKWRRQGLCGQKIGGYAQVTPGDHKLACAGVWLFGALHVGVQLPKAAEGAAEWLAPSAEFQRGQWAKGSWGGHAIPIVAYDPHWLLFVSWGKLMRMSWNFYDAYADEVYVALSAAWVGPNFIAPNAIALPDLMADIGMFAPIAAA